MKLHFLLTQDLESPSGLGRYWPLARALATRGHHVSISALHPNWPELSEIKFERDGVFVEYVAPMHVIKAGNQKQYYSANQLLRVGLQATYALSRAAFSRPVDIIHICKPHPMNSVAGFLAAHLKKSILCVDCDDYEAGSNRFTKAWQKSGVAFFEKRIPRSARLVTTNTFDLKAKLISWGCKTERVFYLSNGIESQRFVPPDPTDVNHLRTQLGLDGKRVVLFVGSLSLPSHPVDLLLQAFVNVYQKFPDATLLIVGGGEDYQALIDESHSLRINEATCFTGRVLPTNVRNYYALSDVAVDPVLDNDAGRGRSPLKLFESWLCGVPFVTSPVGDRQYLLGQPPAGLLAQPIGDPRALAESILQILESKSLAQELSQRGLEAVEQYTWDNLADKLEHVYQELL
jgi:glycosyltransferase involved in cell wall biosynthesis